MRDPFAKLVQMLHANRVRFVVVGVWGANYYARSGGTLFTTQDQDLFLPTDAPNLLEAWRACEAAGLSLWSGDEPLDMPQDLELAIAVTQHRAATVAVGSGLEQVDLSMVMTGLSFEDVWSRRRTFIVDGVDIPVAALGDIVTSKANAGREKDRLFLAAHRQALSELLEREGEPESG